ncbi:hypothetical protein Gotri_023264 [Gossypium trilobum]|uniref:Uncharacterized protein n=1 Tax=Gossypium trilobum TaxID=34281 RepID=A0A7J9DII1_9ROSI|nr:hypothetical protein [Gossypium trilobum]
MANNFSNSPPNLDDGELWLPSDIFVHEPPSKFNPHLHHHHLPFTCMDDLAPRFAALSLPKHHQKLPKVTNFQRLKEPVRYGSVHGAGLGQNSYGFRNGPFLAGTKPVYEFQFLKPTQAQVHLKVLMLLSSYEPSFHFSVEARVRSLQRQQQNRLFQNRGLPFEANGFNNYKLGLGGGLVRESGGTGVFHPRIVNTPFDSTKKQSMRNRQPQEMMKSMKRVGVVKQEDCYYNLPPEMGFHRDWTW